MTWWNDCARMGCITDPVQVMSNRGGQQGETMMGDYSVMWRADMAKLAYEPMLTRASMEADGWAFVAGFQDWRQAENRAAEFDRLPAVERWWVASWASRAADGAA